MHGLMLCFLIFSVFPEIDGEFKDFQYIKVKRLICTSDFKFTLKNLTCFAKPINRNQTGITIDVTFTRPLNYFDVSNVNS